MLWYNRGWGFVCTPSPDRSAPGSSRESAHGWGPSTAKPCSGRAEYSSLTRFLSSTALHGGFPSGGISSHWQRAWSFTPARSCGNCGCGSWGGTTHSLWSINADLWAFYSSVNPEKMKCITVSTKILISITVFNIDNNQKCFLSSKSVY